MNIYEGQYTSHIYGLIKDQNYDEAIRILNSQLEMNPRSRAALSLLGYCNYLSQNYLAAAEMYEQLIKYYPEVVEYRVYLAQSLYKAENYLEALKACQNIDKPELSHQITILQFASKYQMNDLNNAHVLLDNSDPEREETLICQGCVLYKENKFEESKVKFEEAKALCSSPSIDYNIAVCYYKLKQISATNQYLSNIMEYAAKAHPDLVLTTKVEGIKTTSVANSSSLYESCLIEAYNLRAAILYLISVEEARNTLNDMPPRDEEELDSVTLHNLALVNIDKDPDDSFKKMNFLLKNTPCPPEALANLLILYCKYEQYDLAHDVLSENEDLKMKYLTEEEVAYISAIGMMKTNKEVAYEALEKLSKIYKENIMKQRKLLKDADNSIDKQLFNKINQTFENISQK